MFNSRKKRRGAGQSLAEFGLVLPVLMFVLMGIIDFGRIFFTYAQMSAQIRNALRYGVVLGFDAGNQNYLNCAQMEDVADNVYWIESDNADGDADVSIRFYEIANDGSVDTTNANVDTDSDGTSDAKSCAAMAANDTSENGDQLEIEVTGRVRFITPFLPFEALPVSAIGRRTLVKQVYFPDEGDTASDGAPNVSFHYPEDGGGVSGVVTVQVLASDDLDELGSLNVVVSIDGGAFQATTWNSPYYELSWTPSGGVGTPHTLEAQATDSSANVGSVSINVAEGEPIEITDPVDGASLLQGDSNTFTAAEALSGYDCLDIRWFSDIDGQLTAGDGLCSFTLLGSDASDDLSIGDHVITAQTSDGNYLDTINVSVNVDVVTSAQFCLNTTTTDPGNLLNVYRVTGGWTEAGVTWNAAPAYDNGTVHGQIDPANNNSYNCTDVSDLVQNWINDPTNYPAPYALFVAATNPAQSVHSAHEAGGTNNDPKIDITTTQNGARTCFALKDSYIDEAAPDTNFGGDGVLNIQASDAADGQAAVLEFANICVNP